MDRLDAMKVFVVAVDEGSLAAAGRKLGRSPAAVSRAIAFFRRTNWQQTAVSNHAVDQAKRGGGALCRFVPARAYRTRGGR
jgi:hypothetical protein